MKRNGIWYLYVPRQSGGVKLRTCGTGDKALYRAMKRMVAQLKDARRWALLHAIISKRLSLGEVYDAHTANALDALEASLSASELEPYVQPYVAYRLGQGRSPDYLEDLKYQLDAFIEFGATTTAHLTPDMLSSFIGSLTTTSGTNRQYFYAVTGFARYLFAVKRVISAFPFMGMDAPEKNDPRLRYESQANDEAIVRAASPKYRAMFAYIKATGCDVGSAIRTLRRHINLETGRTEVQGRKTKRRKVHEALIESWALPYLRERCADILPNAHVWPTGKGKPGKHGTAETPYYTGSGAYHAHEDACAAVGIEGYNLKDARHSVAVRMAEKGYNTWQIAAQIGTSRKLVDEVYANFLVKLERRETPDATPPSQREAK